MRRLLSGAGAAVAAKALTGFAVTALALTAAGAATEATITGSLNPENWGQQVKQQVAACKAELEAGQHGIGACVSAFASQNGQLHRASGARLNHGNGNANGHDKVKPNNGNGKDKGHGHGQPGQKPNHPVVVASAEDSET